MVKLKSGRVESIENIDLFYHNEHYKLAVPLVNTDDNILVRSMTKIFTQSDSIYRNKTFAFSIYQKQCPKSTRENTSYLHEDNHLPILSEQIETLQIERV